jgi:hypothetical protein
MRKRNRKASCRKIVLRLPDLDETKVRCVEHPDFAKFEAKLQIGDGGIHHMVLVLLGEKESPKTSFGTWFGVAPNACNWTIWLLTTFAERAQSSAI